MPLIISPDDAVACITLTHLVAVMYEDQGTDLANGSTYPIVTQPAASILPYLRKNNLTSLVYGIPGNSNATDENQEGMLEMIGGILIDSCLALEG